MLVQNIRPNRAATLYDEHYNILADFDNFFIMITDESDIYSKESKAIMGKTKLKELSEIKRDLFIRGVYSSNSSRLTNNIISQYDTLIFAYQDISGNVHEIKFKWASINIFHTGIVNIKIPQLTYFEEL